VSGLKREFTALLTISVIVLLALSIPSGVIAFIPSSRPKGNALVLSSVNEAVPMGDYAKTILRYLEGAGFNVTYLTDGAITIDLILNHLNDYSVVIWRTNTFNWVHSIYWYVGEKSNDGVQQKYASDFAAGLLNDHMGVVGMNSDFLKNHLRANTLIKVRLIVFIGGYGNSIAPQFVKAGVSSVIFTHGDISLQHGFIDNLTVQIVSYLTQGQNVDAAVYETVSPFNQGQKPQDPLDSTYAPPFWYLGDGTLTIV
jgi:hypothetical protein